MGTYLEPAAHKFSETACEKKIFAHNFCHNRRQTILHQFDHSPPPIWSLDFTGFVEFLFTFLIIFAANGSVQNHDIMYCNGFGSGFSTHFFLGVNGASLVIYWLIFPNFPLHTKFFACETINMVRNEKILAKTSFCGEWNLEFFCGVSKPNSKFYSSQKGVYD